MYAIPSDICKHLSWRGKAIFHCKSHRASGTWTKVMQDHHVYSAVELILEQDKLQSRNVASIHPSSRTIIVPSLAQASRGASCADFCSHRCRHCCHPPCRCRYEPLATQNWRDTPQTRLPCSHLQRGRIPRCARCPPLRLGDTTPNCLDPAARPIMEHRRKKRRPRHGRMGS